MHEKRDNTNYKNVIPFLSFNHIQSMSETSSSDGMRRTKAIGYRLVSGVYHMMLTSIFTISVYMKASSVSKILGERYEYVIGTLYCLHNPGQMNARCARTWN